MLVADDTESIRALFQKLLSNEGHHVVAVEDGMAALDAVRRHRPDVVLLDVGMPGVDGIEVCRQLKSDPMTRLTPVVLVTGLSDLSDRIKGIEAGADDFLSKPVHPHELRARIAALSRMKQLTDALDSAEAAFVALALTLFVMAAVIVLLFRFLRGLTRRLHGHFVPTQIGDPAEERT